MGLKTQRLRMATGVRNDVSPERFDRDALGRYTGFTDLMEARNLDLDETGQLFTRLGTKRLMEGAAHSLFSFSLSDYAYAVLNGVLIAIDGDMKTYPLRTVSGRRLSWTVINNKAYWSDNIECGMVAGAKVSKWGITPPQPLNPTTTLGSFREGTYLISATYVRGTGEESGAPVATAVTLDGAQGIKLSNFPASTDKEVTEKRIYLSSWNGEALYSVASVPNSQTTVEITAETTPGVMLRTSLFSPPPPGEVVGYFAGRGLIASENFLYMSEPFEYGLFDLAEGFLAFDSKVRTISSHNDGFYVGTERATYWITPAEGNAWNRVQVAPYGTVLGTEVEVRNDLVTPEGVPGNIKMWMSKKGLVMGGEGGNYKNLTGARWIPSVGVEGASLLKIRGGTPQVVTSIFA